MTASIILDIVLLISLIGYAIYGFRVGLVVSLGGILGISVGAIAAFLSIPLVAGWVSDNVWRVPVVLIAMLVLLGAGQLLGLAVGRVIRRGLDRTPLRIFDRLLGAALDLVVAALLMSMLAFSISALGVPFLSQTIASSQGNRHGQCAHSRPGESAARPTPFGRSAGWPARHRRSSRTA